MGRAVNRKLPSPLGFLQVLFLKRFKVLCFHTLLQVLIPKGLRGE